MRRARDHVATTVSDNPWLLVLAGVLVFLANGGDVVGSAVAAVLVLAGVWLWAALRSRRTRSGVGPGSSPRGAFCGECGRPTAGATARGDGLDP